MSFANNNAWSSKRIISFRVPRKQKPLDLETSFTFAYFQVCNTLNDFVTKVAVTVF